MQSEIDDFYFIFHNHIKKAFSRSFMIQNTAADLNTGLNVSDQQSYNTETK